MRFILCLVPTRWFCLNLYSIWNLFLLFACVTCSFIMWWDGFYEFTWHYTGTCIHRHVVVRCMGRVWEMDPYWACGYAHPLPVHCGFAGTTGDRRLTFGREPYVMSFPCSSLGFECCNLLSLILPQSGNDVLYKLWWMWKRLSLHNNMWKSLFDFIFFSFLFNIKKNIGILLEISLCVPLTWGAWESRVGFSLVGNPGRDKLVSEPMVHGLVDLG